MTMVMPAAALPTPAGQDLHALVLTCNKDGMNALRNNQQKTAFEQFKYAEAILIANQKEEGDNTSLLAVTCNNLGCYYKKVGKLHGALSYLRRALKMEVELNTDEVTLAGTHLNLCAILSKLEKHDKAVQHALCALELMDRKVASAERGGTVSQDDYSVLAISYHNVAVERDFLNEWDQAATSFQQGYQVAKRSLGDDHPLTVALEKNCNAVLQKAQKATKHSSTRSGGLPSLSSTRGAPLPMEELANASSAATIRKEAAEWAETGERNPTSWSAGSPKRAPGKLGGVRGLDLPLPEISREDPQPGATRRGQHLLAARELGELTDPDHGQGQLRMTSPVKSAAVANDFRPNRQIKGSTRTARVIRRTGMGSSTEHRDNVIKRSQLESETAPLKSLVVQRMAAERIQRFWRSWHKYCQENREWMTTTWICATMIQAAWRSHHTRRVKQVRAAVMIQKHMRRHLVCRTLRMHAAAVTIQRHIIGVLTRLRLRRLHESAVICQRVIRGGAGRQAARSKRYQFVRTALIVQRYFRAFLARRVTRERRAQRDAERVVLNAVRVISRCYRGWKGRVKAAKRREEHHRELEEKSAAEKVQSHVRREQASKRVDVMRAERLAAMHKSATLVRKQWLRYVARRNFLSLLADFKAHTDRVIAIQRYTRGFLVRLRMWGEAIRAEEELWAVLEIQRIWRGYRGRVAWESQYEKVWLRNMAAATIARHLQGWLARVRVGQQRRKLAKVEFERARLRFRAAQRLQALARGIISRRRMRAHLDHKRKCILRIQKIARGHMLRNRIWTQVLDLRATMINTVARGFLVRNRRFHLVAKVILIQRTYKQWRCVVPAETRARKVEEVKNKERMAGVIQQAYKRHVEQKLVAAGP